MARKEPRTPHWREANARTGSYRAAFSLDPTRFKHPSAGWVKMFKDEFGMTDADFVRPVSQGDEPVHLEAPAAIAPEHRAAIEAIVGAQNVSDDDFSRVKYGHGKTLDENLALRDGKVTAVPDLVVHPRDKQDVAALVGYCAEHKIPVVPYGAGSGVVMGTRADRGGVTLVMATHMNKLLAINERNMTVVVQPGLIGSDFEALLNDAPRLYGTNRAFTCGYFPQSFELASVGGWIAALGTGQASTYYGDAYDLVISQEYVTPVGTIRTKDFPASATGPKVNDILKGNEGTFGVLVEATLKIFRYQPENTQRFAFMLPNWDAAVEFSREVVQGEFGMPAILRISDPEETERGLALKGFDAGLANTFLTKRGFKPWQRCLCVGTAEGEKGFAKHVASQVKRIAKDHGGMSLTGYAEKQWEHGRYSDSFLREDILDFGMIIDTLETSVTWDNLAEVYTTVREFVKSRPGTVCMTHASHFYPQGTNLYFILVLRPTDSDEYFAFRDAIIDKIVESGGSTSHHHGVGNLFAPWLETYLGRTEMDVLRALKAHFDPDGIMNPGNTLGLGEPAMSADLIVAIDAGTQSMRAALVDFNGEIHHLVKTPIEPYFAEQPGYAEQRPEYYWEMLCLTTRQLLEESGISAERILAATVTTQRVTMINVDRDGKPLRPAIVWLDQRKADIHKVLPGFTMPVLKAARVYPLVEYATQYCRSNWIQQNQPDIWERTHKFLFLSGYLTHRLTGQYVDSAGNAIGTVPFDVKSSDWAGRFDLKWRMFPMEREKLPDLVRPTQSLGRITAQAAEETGLPGGLPFIAASNDKACDIIGSGCLTPEVACISFGTTATINTQIQKYVELRPMLPPYSSAVPGEFYTEVAVVRGLWMVSWFKEEFGLQERLMAADSGQAPEELLEELVRDVPPGSQGLVCQPYWTPGPDLEPYAKGAVFGFGDVHTRAHLYRAILEGIVFALKEGARLTEKKNGVPITELRATGGGSRSDSIMQMTADIFDLPVYRPHTPETSVVGAAMDAAVGMGIYADIEEAAQHMTRPAEVFEPIPENRQLYSQLYESVYSKTYEQLRPLYKEIQRITGYPKL